jgi:tRNA pseudouridine55 synthase
VQEVTLDNQKVEEAAASFRGIIEQMPPPFSAKKIHGVPAYKLARKKQEVVLKAVQVEIKEFQILAVELDRVRFRARVGSGTYMRSVAHEMGQAMGCGAHLESLRRTAVAEFALEDAHTLEELTEAAEANTPSGIDEYFVHPRKLLPQFPSVTADEESAGRIRNGRPVNLPELSKARLVKVFAGQKELIAIATRVAGSLFHAKLVFPADEGVRGTVGAGVNGNVHL